MKLQKSVWVSVLVMGMTAASLSQSASANESESFLQRFFKCEAIEALGGSCEQAAADELAAIREAGCKGTSSQPGVECTNVPCEIAQSHIERIQLRQWPIEKVAANPLNHDFCTIIYRTY
jgi:hypothetical protein